MPWLTLKEEDWKVPALGLGAGEGGIEWVGGEAEYIGHCWRTGSESFLSGSLCGGDGEHEHCDIRKYMMSRESDCAAYTAGEPAQRKDTLNHLNKTLTLLWRNC